MLTPGRCGHVLLPSSLPVTPSPLLNAPSQDRHSPWEPRWPKTAEFFNASGKSLAVFQKLRKTAKTCAKDVLAAATCVVPRAANKSTRAATGTTPKASVAPTAVGV